MYGCRLFHKDEICGLLLIEDGSYDLLLAVAANGRSTHGASLPNQFH